ncbi:MAG: class I SAM-dependent methyltransferase [Magnetococcales bacterium]|nr:class I SAM-dependent methyltransferase [Magnetococcales bacterium]
MHTYDPEFYDYSSRLNRASAQVIVSWLLKQLPITSVVDFGCAQGMWLETWQQHGVEDVIGFDGEYVQLDKLRIAPHRFKCGDLAQPVNLGRSFVLTQCLEVAEHLPPESSDTLVANLVRHSSLILFSAAPPGQGGCYHINEQPYSYWQQKFQSHNYRLVDVVRPALLEHREVNAWYRYNLFIFLREDLLPQMPDGWRKHLLERDVSPVDISPLHYRIRKHLIRVLPFWLKEKLADFAARRPGI